MLHNPTEPSHGHAAGTISNGAVGLMRDYTGRGPTRARTTIDGDLVTIVLMDALTRGEQSLVADGRVQLVLDMRKAYQRTMREDLIRLVETTLDRKVIAFLSDNHIDPDIAVEVFILEPEAGAAGA